MILAFQTCAHCGKTVGELAMRAMMKSRGDKSLAKAMVALCNSGGAHDWRDHAVTPTVLDFEPA